MGVCGHLPGVRADGAVLHPADFPVQTNQTAGHTGGGSAIEHYSMERNANRRRPEH